MAITRSCCHLYNLEPTGTFLHERDNPSTRDCGVKDKVAIFFIEDCGCCCYIHQDFILLMPLNRSVRLFVIVSKILPGVQLLKPPPLQYWISKVTRSLTMPGWLLSMRTTSHVLVNGLFMFILYVLSAHLGDGSCRHRFLLHKSYPVLLSSNITKKGSMMKVCAN